MEGKIFVFDAFIYRTGVYPTFNDVNPDDATLGDAITRFL